MSRHAPLSPVSRLGLSSVEILESRLLRASDVRSIDGSGNNLANPAWGTPGSPLIRLAPAGYGDGKSTPAGASRPSARAVSNAVSAQGATEEILSGTKLSAFAYLWGQFIDHDMGLTGTAASNGTLPIAVPKGDPSFDPAATGTQVIPMSRSNAIIDAKGVRQQINQITAYIDGSQVYGSDAVRAAALRTFVGGKLKTSANNLLPYNTAGLPNDNDARIFAANRLFLAGDVRANENSELTAIQTLFMREHNRLAGLIAAAHGNWNDEQIFQLARQLIVGEIQNITYNEYLPALLGKSAIASYAGYKPNVNAGLSTEFSTAAYRLGHSMLADDVEFINNDGSEADEQLALSQVFFNPTVTETHGISTTLKYLASSNSQEIDTKVVVSLRNFLFGPPGAGGLDLASLNIQRGRDHGLASYNATRVALGLSKLTSFNQISSDPAVVAKIKSVYASVDDIDLWVGGLAEDHVAGSNLGATFQKIVADQFTRTRDGDRFYFERDLNAFDLNNIRKVTLANVVGANTGISNLQDNVFVFNATASGTVFADLNGNKKRDLLELGKPGVKLNLTDSTGYVFGTTTTDLLGRYSFSNLPIGPSKVVVALTGTDVATTGGTNNVFVSRGQAYTNVDFGVRDSRGAIRTILASVARPTTTTAMPSVTDDLLS